MTSEYKRNLINWLTGNFTTSSGTEAVSQTGEVLNVNELKQFLTNNYTTTNCVVIKNVKSTVNSNTASLLYDNDNQRSIIIIFNENLQPIKLLTSYASGTQFKHILNMNVGEDGDFFLIENTGSAIRFVMCSNITAGDTLGNYQVTLRKAYNVGGNLVNLIDVWEIIKYPDQAKYLVIGTDTDMTPSTNIATEIVVNVGSANEYNDFTFSGSTGMIYGDLYYTPSGDSISFKICGTLGSNYIEMTNNNYVISTTTYSIGSGIYTSRVTKLNSTEAYIVTYNNNGSYSFYYFNGSTISQIATESYGDSFKAIRGSLLNINRINGVVYGIILVDFDNTHSNIRSFTIVNNSYQASIVGDEVANTDITNDNIIVASNQVYDLYNFVYAFGNLTTLSYVIYNEGRYNGDTYIDYNYFIPSYAKIIVNDEPVFARGLYNFTILNNTSTAIINIPNSYVNDEQFTPNLYGQTNGWLMTSSETYQKNIYENLLINFNSSIDITNDNIYVTTPAIRLNKSVLNHLDYDNSKIGWARINYENSIRDVAPNITQIDDTNYKVDFTLMASDNINNVQILSNDKETIYDQFTIEYDLGKIYSVERSIEIN